MHPVRAHRWRLLKEPKYRFHDPSDDAVRQYPEDDQRDEEEDTRAPIGAGLQRQAGALAADSATAEATKLHGRAGPDCQRRAVTQSAGSARRRRSGRDWRGDDQSWAVAQRASRWWPSCLRSRRSGQRCCGICLRNICLRDICLRDARGGGRLCRHRTRILIRWPSGIFTECSGNRLPGHVEVRDGGQRQRRQPRGVAPGAAPRRVGPQLGQLGAVNPEQGVRHRLAHHAMVPCSGALVSA
jgi:hypothetical protein